MGGLAEREMCRCIVPASLGGAEPLLHAWRLKVKTVMA